MCGNKDLVRLDTHGNMAARVATGAARDHFPRGEGSRSERAVEFLVGVCQNRKKVAGIARLPQSFQHGCTGLFEESILFRGKLSTHQTSR